jgi:hypothetical protein
VHTQIPSTSDNSARSTSSPLRGHRTIVPWAVSSRPTADATNWPHTSRQIYDQTCYLPYSLNTLSFSTNSTMKLFLRRRHPVQCRILERLWLDLDVYPLRLKSQGLTSLTRVTIYCKVTREEGSMPRTHGRGGQRTRAAMRSLQGDLAKTLIIELIEN